MAKKMIREPRHCVWCYEVFIPVANNNNCCSRQCLIEKTSLKQRWDRIIKKKNSPPKEKPKEKIGRPTGSSVKYRKTKQPEVSLAEMQKRAKKAGMSYGMYMARTEGGMRC